MSVIETAGLEKTFTVSRRSTEGGLLTRFRRETRTVTAVGGVSFTIQPGEIVGYIGPNGAGKSTTIKMLTGILVPSAGHIRVAGLEPARQRVELARRIGVVFGQRTGLWWDLPLRDSFDLLRYIYRIPAERFAVNLDRFIALLDLGPVLDTPVRQLSLGQRMRGDLAAALLHDPEILYLDEPTIGLDVVAKARIREFLLTLNRDQGVTILLTTHDMDDIERLCARVIVIDRGQLLYDGALAALAGRFGGERTLIVDLQEEAPPLVVPGTRTVQTDGPRQWLRFRPEDASAAEVVAAVAARAPVRDLTIEEPEIEEIVRRIYEGDGGRELGVGEGQPSRMSQ